MKDQDIKTTKKATTVSVNQACNQYKISGYYRIHIEKKYKGKTFLASEWKKIFTDEGLI